MRHRAWILASVTLAAAACSQPDPLAEQRSVCGSATAEAEAKVAACTELLDSGKLDVANRSIALSNRGGASEEAGDVTAALRDFQAALEADPENLRAVRGRAAILIASGQLDAAEPLVDRLIASGEFGDIAHYLKGDILAQRHDAAGALAAYDAAIQGNSRFAEAFAARGRVKQGQSDYAGALADFDAALAINPQFTPALAGRCWARVLIKDGDAVAARADADAAAVADPRDVRAQMCRGLLQLRAQEWEGARQSYDAALAVEAGNPTALFGRGIARRRAGDDAGREDMNLARDFDRRIGEEFRGLGVETF
jgi:tetratricopeptide (TPR) repeat protein